MGVFVGVSVGVSVGVFVGGVVGVLVGGVVGVTVAVIHGPPGAVATSTLLTVVEPCRLIWPAEAGAIFAATTSREATSRVRIRCAPGIEISPAIE